MKRFTMLSLLVVFGILSMAMTECGAPASTPVTKVETVVVTATPTSDPRYPNWPADAEYQQELLFMEELKFEYVDSTNHIRTTQIRGSQPFQLNDCIYPIGVEVLSSNVQKYTKIVYTATTESGVRPYTLEFDHVLNQHGHYPVVPMPVQPEDQKADWWFQIIR